MVAVLLLETAIDPALARYDDRDATRDCERAIVDAYGDKEFYNERWRETGGVSYELWGLVRVSHGHDPVFSCRIKHREVVSARLRDKSGDDVVGIIGAVTNHYALGYRANGMSVWDVADDRIFELGPAVGAVPSVTHCYRRPRHLPAWPYNLFAMVHGRTRDAVAAEVARIATLMGPACRGHDFLYSTAILKKAGLRLGE